VVFRSGFSAVYRAGAGALPPQPREPWRCRRHSG
jgi:hypothetical protein